LSHLSFVARRDAVSGTGNPRSSRRTRSWSGPISRTIGAVSASTASSNVCQRRTAVAFWRHAARRAATAWLS